MSLYRSFAIRIQLCIQAASKFFGLKNYFLFFSFSHCLTFDKDSIEDILGKNYKHVDDLEIFTVQCTSERYFLKNLNATFSKHFFCCC